MARPTGTVTVLRVLVDDWEVGCCVGPPAVGQRVAWLLQAFEAQDRGDPERLQRLRGRAEPLPGWEGATAGRSPTLLRVGTAGLYWEPAAPVTGPVEVLALVHLAQHGEAPGDLPPVEGVVRRVRLAGTLYREVPPGSRSWEPVLPLDVRYRDVPASPRWSGSPQEDSSPRRVESGLLVDLEPG